MTVELLSKVFSESLGRQRDSIFGLMQGFEITEREIRREMEHLKSSAHKDLQIDVRHDLHVVVILF